MSKASLHHVDNRLYPEFVAYTNGGLSGPEVEHFVLDPSIPESKKRVVRSIDQHQRDGYPERKMPAWIPYFTLCTATLIVLYFLLKDFMETRGILISLAFFVIGEWSVYQILTYADEGEENSFKRHRFATCIKKDDHERMLAKSEIIDCLALLNRTYRCASIQNASRYEVKCVQYVGATLMWKLLCNQTMDTVRNLVSAGANWRPSEHLVSRFERAVESANRVDKAINDHASKFETLGSHRMLSLDSDCDALMDTYDLISGSIDSLLADIARDLEEYERDESSRVLGDLNNARNLVGDLNLDWASK